jgi:8-oxo-dGTP pyrophosphatase MutT (NUDIX family)
MRQDDNNDPEQAAAIAVRRSGRRLEVCLIRRKGARGWGIPKGLVEDGETHRETALKEAWEEAGLTGRLVGRSLGTYDYQKWGATLTVAVYLMEVEAQEKVWEEAWFRERRWMSFDDALALLKEHPAGALLDRARRLGKRALLDT